MRCPVPAILLICALMVGCASVPVIGHGPAMVVSVSSDGRYAVSSHRNRRLVLWDIEGHNRKVISRSANLYSARFVPERAAFVWQDLDDVVHVQSVAGKTLKQFQHFPTYGHVMTSDLQTYVSVTSEYELYHGYKTNLRKFKDAGGGFYGFGKLFNIDLNNDQDRLLTAGFGSPHDATSWPLDEQAAVGYQDIVGVAIWDLKTLRPHVKLPGNSAKTHATLSPDGLYAVSGCENAHGYVWDVATGERLKRRANLRFGILREDRTWDDSGVISMPPDFRRHSGAYLATKFVHESDYYLQFITYEPYVFLFETENPFPVKYFPLAGPRPAVDDYSRNAAIDTAPKANILVTGQSRGNGINVYRFDPEALTLELIWSPRG